MVALKIALLGVVAAVCVISVKEYRADIAMLISIVAGVMILLTVVDYFSDIFARIKVLLDTSEVDTSLIKYLIKIVSIGIIIELSSSTIEESGQKALADKVVIAGKIIIIALTMPLIEQLFGIIGELI